MRVDEFEFLGQAVGADAKVVFDVGAKHGRYTGQFLRLFPEATVYAVDCSPYAVAELERKYGQHERVEIVNEAFLNAISPAIDFHVCEMAGSSGTHRVSGVFSQETRNTETLSVVSTTLGTFCSARGIDSIDLLKIDCEGSDLDVLLGCKDLLRWGAVRAVHVELLFFPYYEGQCWYYEVSKHLVDLGLTLKAMWPTYWGGRLRYAQAFFE